MNRLTLAIGNKNYSSWSLRPWLLLKQFDVPFEEIRIPLYEAGSKEALQALSPSGLVPALIHGDVKVWDSLAICEYVQELFSTMAMWPHEREARAIARSISCEMHAGFGALRSSMPMNCIKTFPGKGLNPEAEADIRRIQQIWRDCRSKYGKNGPLLFGNFTIADAMFAPVVLRFETYRVELDDDARAYASAVLELPAMQEWLSAASRETEVLPRFEPYETTT